MTEKLLRDSLIEAQGKGEIGLFIWANWRVWDDLAFNMKEGDEKYDFAISQVLKQEGGNDFNTIMWISSTWDFCSTCYQNDQIRRFFQICFGNV